MAEKKVADADEKPKERATRGLVLRGLLPTKEVIAREVTSKPKGTSYKVARLFGYVTEAVSKTKTNDDASVSNIVSLEGVFQQEGGKRYSSITLTQAFSNAIKKHLETMSVVKIDVSVLLKNTGVAGAPYEWVISSEIAGGGSDAMAVFLADKKE